MSDDTKRYGRAIQRADGRDFAFCDLDPVPMPTHGWTVTLAFLILGVARLVLTPAYIRTKSIAASTGAQCPNDRVVVTATMLAVAARP